LLREGYIVEETDTGRMALSSFRLNPADLVIVHVTDPEQAGFETIRALRALSVTVPILAMLGESLANLPTQSIIVQNLGASRTLQTAVESDQLLGIVARLLIRVEAPS
jgi:DNA-binding response OmpR family regulator